MLKLYDYFRSSAAYRARIALNLKGLEYDSIPVHLTRGGGEQFGSDYSAVNPQHLVPALVDGDLTVNQSMAIIEYLDEVYPDPAILPRDAAGRAHVRALAQIVACDIHPVNNLRIRKYIVEELGCSEDQRDTWMRHWITKGFEAYEAFLAAQPNRGRFSYGDTPSMADICLIPQIFNARAAKADLDPFPLIRAVDEACQALPAFQNAHPSKQPDSE
mgnify:CR=1 FL=1